MTKSVVRALPAPTPVAAEFSRTLSAAVSSCRVEEVVPLAVAELLGANACLVRETAAPLPDDGLTWRETPLSGGRSLAVGCLPDMTWTSSHAAALTSMAAMVTLAMEIEREEAEERVVRASQATMHETIVRDLEHRQKVFGEMVQVQRALARRAPLQSKLDLVTKAVREVLEVDMSGIRLLDRESDDELVIVSGTGLDDTLPLRSHVAGAGVGGAAFRANDTVVVHDYGAYDAALKTYGAKGVCAAMATPVQQFGRAVGSIVVASRQPGRRFSANDSETLRAFADQASIALTEHHLFTEMQQGLIDPLTGLANRARLHDQLTTALELTTAMKSGPAVLFIDLDGFKRINDAMGHGAGDELLVKVASRLRATVSSPNLVARFGGDEFTVLLPSVARLAEATQLADDILAALTPRCDIRGQDVLVSASVGIAWERRSARRMGVATASDLAADMLRRADTAMYRAKNAGRNRYAVFEERMHDELLLSIERERELRAGVAEDQLGPYFQPVVDLATGRFLGAEALVRWHRDGRLVSPAEFMTVAEETGLIVPVGRTVLHRSCALLGALHHAGQPHLTMSVNLSPRELDSDGLIWDVRRELEAAQIPPSALIIELTESALMRDVRSVAAVLQDLRDLGVRIAIDDFGTGYSSLGRLRTLPIDILKIDRSFVDLVDTDESSHAMLRAVLQLAEALKLDVVVEGVEREEQRQVLVELGCVAAQGYLFSAAVPREQFTAMAVRGSISPPGAPPA